MPWAVVGIRGIIVVCVCVCLLAGGEGVCLHLCSRQLRGEQPSQECAWNSCISLGRVVLSYRLRNNISKAETVTSL